MPVGFFTPKEIFFTPEAASSLVPSVKAPCGLGQRLGPPVVARPWWLPAPIPFCSWLGGPVPVRGEATLAFPSARAPLVKQKITHIYHKFSMYFLYNCTYSFIFDRGCTIVSFELASPLIPVALTATDYIKKKKYI